MSALRGGADEGIKDEGVGRGFRVLYKKLGVAERGILVVGDYGGEENEAAESVSVTVESVEEEYSVGRSEMVETRARRELRQP